MRRLWTLMLLFGLLAPPASAQLLRDGVVQALEPSPYGILSNSITNLHAQGDSLWVGPLLNLTTDGGATWLAAEADSLRNSPNRVFSMDIEGDVIWVGLGFVDDSGGDGVQAAGGFLVSRDGGATFEYRFPQLDAPTDDTVVYGGNTLEALPVIVPQQSPPFDIDYDPVRDEVWVAGWASGIRRSSDGGRTWQRVVLPPDELDAITPEGTYDFVVEPQRGGRGELNYLGFSVLVDEAGTVWAGTPRGVNRSTDGGASWQRFSAEGTPSSLTGSWVISIEEEPFDDPATPIDERNPVWMATWNAGEVGEEGRFGATVTRDGGATFEQTLIGERIYDFGFDDGTVYAAGENGLFVSADGGRSWNQIRTFRDATGPLPLRPDLSVFAVATTEDALWVGTSDGLLKSTDGGTRWTVFRVEVPLDPDEPTERVPRTETFAYPNPFSPFADRFVRLRYELDAARDVEVRIVDFAMNLVRRLDAPGQSAGIHELTWDGTDERGVRVANGTYFYVVDTGADTFTGKILVLE